MHTPSFEQCSCCGLAVAALVEKAHVPNRATEPDKIIPLCILCHRAYDIGLTTDDEMENIRNRWLNGLPAPHAHDELVAIWNTRAANWSRLHQGGQKRAGLTIRRSTRAKRAWKTRRKKMEDQAG